MQWLGRPYQAHWMELPKKISIVLSPVTNEKSRTTKHAGQCSSTTIEVHHLLAHPGNCLENQASEDDQHCTTSRLNTIWFQKFAVMIHIKHMFRLLGNLLIIGTMKLVTSLTLERCLQFLYQVGLWCHTGERAKTSHQPFQKLRHLFLVKEEAHIPISGQECYCQPLTLWPKHSCR